MTREVLDNDLISYSKTFWSSKRFCQECFNFSLFFLGNFSPWDFKTFSSVLKAHAKLYTSCRFHQSMSIESTFDSTLKKRAIQNDLTFGWIPFELFIFYSLFMYKTWRWWPEGWLEATKTFLWVEIEKNLLELLIEALSYTSLSIKRINFLW